MSDKVLTKAGLVDAVQARVGLPRKITAEFVEDLLETIKEQLAKGESVKISGFGNFEVRRKTARRGRNPQTGESLTIPPRSVVTFKPSQVLRKSIRNES